jgi:hypothetical protein
MNEYKDKKILNILNYSWHVTSYSFMFFLLGLVASNENEERKK